MSPAVQGKAEQVGVTVRLTPYQHQQLKAMAARGHRSLTQELRLMVELYLTPDPSERSAA